MFLGCAGLLSAAALASLGIARQCALPVRPPSMKFCNPGMTLSSATALLLAGAATVEVSGFVQHVPTLSRCGATSLERQHSCSISMGASGSDQLSRGAWVGKALSVAFSSVAVVTQGSEQASAGFGDREGGLPDGARQFSNLLKVQKDWKALGKTIRSQGADVTPEEWKNVALFLRKVYQLGGDLEFLAGRFSSDKKKAGLELVRGIQKEVEAADKPARERNAEGFLAAQGSVEKKFEDFMELFNDVPSEL